jgi:hypothetical protein
MGYTEVIMYVVIGTAPTWDVSLVAGPFRSIDRAHSASVDMTTLGYNTEVCPLWRVADMSVVDTWEQIFAPEE